MRNLKKKIGDYYYSILRLYFQLRFWYPVWFYLLNHTGRRAYQTERSSLNAVQKRIVRNLKKDGITLVHIFELFPKKNWTELKGYTKQLSRRPEVIKKIANKEAEPPNSKSDIIIHLLGGYGSSKPPLDVLDPFIRFTTSNTIIRIVASYLAMLPKFTMFSLHSTILMPPNAPKVFSQNWHRDPDDMKIVKVFLYVSDVNSKKDGPFIYVKGSQFGGKWRHIFPQRPPMGSYPPSGAVESIVSPKDIKICTGKAGTIIFCDTSGLHRGGHSLGKRRLMFAGTFTTQVGQKDRGQNFKIISPKRDLNSLSDIARYSLT